MISMEMNEYIRFAHQKLGHGIRKISRDTGLDRKTIRRALSATSVRPEYIMKASRTKTVMGPFMEQIRDWA